MSTGEPTDGELTAEAEPFDGLLLSESVLAREWDTPTEDAAWSSL